MIPWFKIPSQQINSMVSLADYLNVTDRVIPAMLLMK